MVRSNKILVSTAAAAAVCMLGGCSGQDQKHNDGIFRIGVIVYDQYDTFISEMMTCFTNSLNEKFDEKGRSITIEIMDAAGSQSTQNDQAKLLAEKGCDVLCVNLVDRTEPTTITDLAEKNDVPIIFFNRELVAEDLERWDQLYYVGADATQSGQLQGELAAEVFQANAAADHNGDGICQYVILEGEAGHQDAIIRTEYSVNALKSAGLEIQKLGYARANWNRAQAQTQVRSLLDEFGDEIELIVANNDDMALGAIDALKATDLEKSDWPVVVGIDGTEDGLAAVRKKEMAGTVYNDKEGQAEAMAEICCALAEDGNTESIQFTNERYIRLPYQTVTAENVGEF